ncbi:MAG: NAD(P)H-hydrate epimerase [Elusimicrobia bacterium]|nr:NAD(P)H-hydrate epimerase [Elusimicrobiota bacterium]
MRAVTAARIQAIDRWAIETLGIPSICLMENAGRAVADAAGSLLGRSRRKNILIISGPGHNGGDGLVAARHLMARGFSVKVLMTAPEQDLRPDTLCYYRSLVKMRVPVAHDLRRIAPLCSWADLVIDAVFGVGLSRPLAGPLLDLVRTINLSGRSVVSVDVPSGLNATTGRILGAAVKARVTVTFTAIKTGLLRGEGPRISGKVRVVDIGIPLKRKDGR